MYYEKENVTFLEVEMTSHCNSHCGACHRNIDGGHRRPDLKLENMTFDVWEKIIRPENLEYIQILNLDGNVGDASLHPHLIEMLDMLYEQKPEVEVRISTNGGARSPEFWSSLAQCLQKFKTHVLTFSVDGLEYTNDIYRRGVRWKRLVENIKQFNQAGGYSRWRCIVFDHNKNQIEEIEQKAEEVGCSSFVTFRNRKPEIYQTAFKNYSEVKITSPSLNDFETYYKKSTIFKTQPHLRGQIHTQHPQFECPFAAEGKIAVDQKGYIWPCCFAAVDNGNSFPTERYKKNCDIRNNTFEGILKFFREDLYRSWAKEPYVRCQNCLHKKSPPTYSPVNA